MCATVFVSVLEHIICLKASWAISTPKLLEDADLEELGASKRPMGERPFVDEYPGV